MARRKRAETDSFTVSFLDVASCGFGAMIILLMIVKPADPAMIEVSEVPQEASVTVLQEQLFEIRDGGRCGVRNICGCFHPLQPKILCINDTPGDWLRAVEGKTDADEEPLKKRLFFVPVDDLVLGVGMPIKPQPATPDAHHHAQAHAGVVGWQWEVNGGCLVQSHPWPDGATQLARPRSDWSLQS